MTGSELPRELITGKQNAPHRSIGLRHAAACGVIRREQPHHPHVLCLALTVFASSRKTNKIGGLLHHKTLPYMIGGTFPIDHLPKELDWEGAPLP